MLRTRNPIMTKGLHQQRSRPLTPPTKLSKSMTSKSTSSKITDSSAPVKIPLVSRLNNHKTERSRTAALPEFKTKFHRETIAADKHEKIQNIKKMSDTLLIAKPETDDELLRITSKRRKNYKKKVDERKGTDSKSTLPHQDDSNMVYNRKKEIRNFNKGLQQSAQDLDGEIESYFEVLKNSISELVQEKVNQVFKSCINVMMNRFNEMAEHMNHQEDRMLKHINQINTKIVHYGEHHSRHFHYLCMKAEYDKLSKQSLTSPKKCDVENMSSSTQYGKKHSNDASATHCPNCPCTPHLNCNTNSYNSYSTNKKNQHLANPPSEGPVLVSATESNEKPIKLPRGGSDSAVNTQKCANESIAQLFANTDELSVASLIGEFRKRKLAANNIGLRVPPCSPDGEPSQQKKPIRNCSLRSEKNVSNVSSALDLKDMMQHTINNYYNNEPVESLNNQYQTNELNSKKVFDGSVDFKNTDEEFSDDYSTSREDMLRN